MNLEPDERLLETLRRHAAANGLVCMRNGRMAELSGLDVRQVRSELRELVGQGRLLVVGRRGRRAMFRVVA